jgi:hypothetical protein
MMTANPKRRLPRADNSGMRSLLYLAEPTGTNKIYINFNIL